MRAFILSVRLNRSLNLSNKGYSQRFVNKLAWLCLGLVCLVQNFSAQVNQQLTPEIQAYLFHIVRKSPILERNIGKAFEYNGPLILLPDKTVNYDSIDRILTLDPNLLIIRTEVLSKCPKGILTEACNKTAMYEICRQIQKYGEGESIESLPLLDQYLGHFFSEIPNEYLRGKIYELLVNPLESPVLLSNISFNERLLNLAHSTGIKHAECKKILEAQGKSVNKVIADRTRVLFQLLGGNSSVFESILMAAGDGSFTEGMLQERDKDENGEWNKGLPRAIGLFPYELFLTNEKKASLKTKRITEYDFYTVGKLKETQVHFDVWGYNSSNQTTIIVEKGDLQYPLFGSQTTRFLTPDSTFSKGTTFMKVLNDLNDVTYRELKEQLEGREGLNVQIENTEKQLSEIETQINQTEGDLGELYKENYRTRNKTTREERRRKRRGDTDLVLNPTTKARNKAKGKHQTEIIDLYMAYDETQVHLDELITEQAEVSKEFEHRDRIYKQYQKMLGQNWSGFTEKDGLYTFEDGTTFDIYTQDLTFPSSDTVERITVRLLSIPEDYEGETSDEIMLHLSMVDAIPYYDADFQINFEDVFSSDEFVFRGKVFSSKDTIFFKKMFDEYKKNPFGIQIELDGMGVGQWEDSLIVRDLNQVETAAYPGSTAEERSSHRESQAFKSLRHSAVQIKINRDLHIHVQSSTDPVVSNLDTPLFNVDSYIKSNQITRNELLSMLRSRAILLKTQEELVAISPKYLNTQQAKKFIDQLELSIEKSKYKVGGQWLKLPKIKD